MICQWKRQVNAMETIADEPIQANKDEKFELIIHEITENSGP